MNITHKLNQLLNTIQTEHISINPIFNYNIKTNSKIKIQFNNMSKVYYLNKIREKFNIITFLSKSEQINYNILKYIYFNNIFVNKTKFSQNEILLNINYKLRLKLHKIPKLKILFLEDNFINPTPIKINYNNISNSSNIDFKYIYSHHLPKINDKQYMQMDSNLSEKYIKINTNKFDKNYLLELKNANLPKIDFCLQFSSYNELHPKNELQYIIGILHNFLLCSIFSNINANAYFHILFSVTHISYQLIYLISKFYKKVIFVHDKLFQHSLVIYIQCQGFKGISDKEFNELLNIYDKWCKIQPNLGVNLNSHNEDERTKLMIKNKIEPTDTTTFVESIFEEELPESFVSKLNSHITKILDKSEVYYNYLDWVNKNEKTINEKELDNALIKIAVDIYTELGIPIKPEYNSHIYKSLSTKRIQANKSIVYKSYHEYISHLIKQHKMNTCILIGLQFGKDSLKMCKALQENSKQNKGKDYLLYSIEINQFTKYNGIAIENIKKDGLDQYHKLIQKPTSDALSALSLTLENKIQLILFHTITTLKESMLELFYANLLLQIGGYIILLNATESSVIDVLKYIEGNFETSFKKLDININTIAVYQKIK